MLGFRQLDLIVDPLDKLRFESGLRGVQAFGKTLNWAFPVSGSRWKISATSFRS